MDCNRDDNAPIHLEYMSLLSPWQMQLVGPSGDTYRGRQSFRGNKAFAAVFVAVVAAAVKNCANKLP